MPQPSEHEIEVFNVALELSGRERAEYLDKACAGEAALRQRVEELLQASAESCPSLEGAPAVSPGPGRSVRQTSVIAEKPGDRIGRYKLLQQIGEGGCGIVYMAEQEEPVRRRVALKVIKLGMDTKQVIARFEAERQALALMDHPNIARVLDAGATDIGRPFFVMELVRGVKITDYCDQNNLSTKERLDLFVQVCHAVQHAHQKGIIHRDIKPSNILVTMDDRAPLPKVIDFGIAKATQGKLTDHTLFTAFEQFIGTPTYMSPEQAEMRVQDIDTRSDIYSLGVLLYELLTGQTPIDAKKLLEAGLEEIRRTIREREPVRPSTRLSTMLAADLTTVAGHRQVQPPRLVHLVRGDLDWIVMKCLEKDRTRRYETANGLAVDIQRHLSNEPVAARPPSTAYLVQKTWRRNRLVFTAAALIAATLIVGIAISSWQAIEAGRARNAEKKQLLAAQAAQQAEKQQRELVERREAAVSRLLYIANMNVAQQAWDQNNIARLRQELEETQDSPYRGFEWYYWQPQTHMALMTLRGHLGPVLAVAVSPDGRRIATASGDTTAKIWDAASGRELLTLKGHRDWIKRVAFSPDGRRIVTASHDQTARVWDVATGRELFTLKGHSDVVGSALFSPDGRKIVTGSWDKTAKVWDAVTGRELLTLKGHTGRIWAAVAISPNGQRIATASSDPDDKTAIVWDAVTGRELLRLKGHTDPITFLAFSPDNERIATASKDKTAKVWDAATGRELLTLKAHSSFVLCVTFSPDGQWLATSSDDNTVKVWDAATGRELRTLKGHGGGIASLAFYPDGRRLVTGSQDYTAKVWDADSGLSGNETGRSLYTLKGHSNIVFCAAFSPDGHRIVTGSWDKTAKVWDADSGRELLTIKGNSGEVYGVAFSPDGQRIVIGGQDATAKVCDAASGNELLTLKGHGDLVSSVAFSPDGRRIVTSSADHTAKVWDAASGHELLTLSGHSDVLTHVAWSPDGQRIVTVSYDQTAKVWEAGSGRELLTLKGHSGRVWAAAFSLDSQRIVTGAEDNMAKVWDAANGTNLLTLKGHSGWVVSAAFSPDGERIVTGGADLVAKLWEAASGRELLTLRGHTGGAMAAGFSPDGQRILTGSVDQTAKVWEAAGARQIAAWQHEEQAADQDVATARIERTKEEERQRLIHARDAIKQWLILAPIALSAGQSGTEGLDIEQIGDEGQLRPRSGDAASIGGKEFKWKEVDLKDYVLDFDATLGQVTPRSVAYAVCYIQSEAEQRGLQMLVGSQDEAKVYLNGKEVYKAALPHGKVEVKETVQGIVLSAGLNTLVFKVVNETQFWKGSIELRDAQGNPVKGIKVTIDAETKNSP
jgi:eukaryotic-like serine/threonine-protein kinase